jgi:DNA-binding transcriptional LysR family regulator
LDIRFLRSLIAIVETGSIAAAARREGITPAALSQRIQVLERDFGCALLNRSAHAAAPSEDCLLLLPRIRNLVREASSLHDEISRGGLSGEIRIGAIASALTGIFPYVLHRASASAPQLRIRVTPGSSRDLYEKVVAGVLDAAVVVEPPFKLPKGFKYTIVRREPLMLLTTSRCATEAISDCIASHPYIRYDESSWGGRIAQKYLVDHDLDPDVRFDIDALQAIAILVAQGVGNSLVPRWAGARIEGCHSVAVQDPDKYTRAVVLLSGNVPMRPRAVEFIKNIICSTEIP